MKRALLAMACLGLVSIFYLGCGETEEEVNEQIQEFIDAFCDKMDECNKFPVVSDPPVGDPQTVIADAAECKTKVKVQNPGTCSPTDEEVDECLTDIGTENCNNIVINSEDGTSFDLEVPMSCQLCEEEELEGACGELDHCCDAIDPTSVGSCANTDSTIQGGDQGACQTKLDELGILCGEPEASCDVESAGDCCSALGACCDDIDPDENDECAVHGGIADAGVDANCKMSLDTLNALGECTGEDVEGACAELDQCCMHANAALACGAIENLQDLISAGDDAECAPTLSIVDLFCVDDPLF